MLGRLLIVLGLIVVIVGFVGSVVPGVNINPMAVIDSSKAGLCKPTEKLVEESGASSRIPGTNTFASSTVLTCVDREDPTKKRDVTGEFAGSLAGGMMGQLGSLAPFLLTTACLPTCGGLLLLLGIILLVINQSRRKTVNTAGLYNASGDVLTIDGSNVKAALAQLDEALMRGQITQDQYNMALKALMPNKRKQ